MDWQWDQLQVIILARVSDDRDGHSDSTNQQVEEAVELCKDRGATVLEILVEDDIGASRYSRKARPNFDRALELIRQRSSKRRMLITWESSRSTRQLKRHIELREALEGAEALWMYGGRVYDMRDPDDRKRAAQDAIEDEYEVERTRKRVMRDMKKTAAAGKPHGKLAYGYRIVRDERTGRSIGRVIYDEQADVVREIARRILAGESIHAIVVDLNRRGIHSPRPHTKGPHKGEPAPWRTNAISTLITSPTYAGLRTTHGVVTGPATWPPILTIDEHERLKAILDSPTRISHRGVEPRWLLTAPVAMCGECGGAPRILKSAHGPTLSCGDRHCFGALAGPVEALVERAVIDRLTSPDVVALLAAGDKQAVAAFDEERALQRRLTEVIEQSTDMGVSPVVLARMTTKLESQIATAKRRARAAIPSELVREFMGEQAPEKWAAASMSSRRMLVRALVEVRIFRGGKGTRHLNPRRVHLRWVGSDEPVPKELPPPVPLAEGGDPMDFTQAQVKAYLRSAGVEERHRVIEMEKQGQARYDLVRFSVDPRRAKLGVEFLEPR